MQPAVTAPLLQRLADRPAASEGHPAPQALTTREVEILELMAGGFANREIARALHLAEGTVKNHVSSILLKLGARDRDLMGEYTAGRGTASGYLIAIAVIAVCIMAVGFLSLAS